MEGGGRMEQRVLGREERRAAQLGTAHDVVLELLELLEVGRLEGGVQVGWRPWSTMEKV